MAKRPKRFFAGDEVSDYDSGEGAGAAGTSQTVKPKSSTVTKEQLAESGLSLRDYMNKQQGLTRRGESAPDTPSVRRINREEAESAISKAAEPSSVRKLSREEGESIKKASAPAKPDVTKMSANERIKQDVKDNLASARAGSGKTDTRSVNQRIRSAFGMAKGGTASSRADGIATKGKTRGRMC